MKYILVDLPQIFSIIQLHSCTVTGSDDIQLLDQSHILVGFFLVFRDIHAVYLSKISTIFSWSYSQSVFQRLSMIERLNGHAISLEGIDIAASFTMRDMACRSNEI